MVYLTGPSAALPEGHQSPSSPVSSFLCECSRPLTDSTAAKGTCTDQLACNTDLHIMEDCTRKVDMWVQDLLSIAQSHTVK